MLFTKILKTFTYSIEKLNKLYLNFAKWNIYSSNKENINNKKWIAKGATLFKTASNIKYGNYEYDSEFIYTTLTSWVKLRWYFIGNLCSRFMGIMGQKVQKRTKVKCGQPSSANIATHNEPMYFPWNVLLGLVLELFHVFQRNIFTRS